MYTANKKIETFHPAYRRVEKTQNAIRMLFRSYKVPRLQLIILCLTLAMLGQSAYAATQVSQFGITWTFDKDYTVGQFANGDYWVVGPVTIINIDPMSTDIGGRVKHGSMINPSPSQPGPIPGVLQGYDNSLWPGYSEYVYDSSLNVGRPNNQDISASNPLVVQPGSSLISLESVDTATAAPQFQTGAILTVLDSPAPAGSFRPPYSGTDKTIRFNKNQLNYSLLENLPITASIRNVMLRLKQQRGDAQADSVERMFERPWIDHILW
jgi:hypothetical protein